MLIAIIILNLLLLALWCIWKLRKSEIQHTTVVVAEQSAPAKELQLSPVSEATVVTGIPVADMIFTNVWWYKLSTLQQLQLALAVSQKALPVWEKYTAVKDVTYRTSATGTVNKIDHKILQTAIDEIIQSSQFQFPDKDNKRINNCYNSFISTVLAMQDGVWQPPYPVKKIFMAVYSILKSIVEQNNYSDTATILSVAINQALDCIDITKLYIRMEIDSFLEEYKNKLSANVCKLSL